MQTSIAVAQRSESPRAPYRRALSSFLARLALPLLLGAAATACAPEVTTAPKTGADVTTPKDDKGAQTGGTSGGGAANDAGAKPPANPWAVDRKLRADPSVTLDDGAVDASAPKLAPAPKGLPAAPRTCDAFAKRKAAKPPACADAAAGLSALDAAMVMSDAAKRDEALAGLEACAGLPVGVVRSLRAELAPAECADAIVEPMLKSPPTNIKKMAYYSLLGQALAARLARSAEGAPTLKPPFEKKRVEEFQKGPLLKWLDEQGRVIQEIAKVASTLPFYAQGVVAIEAGMADMRVVEAFRGAAIPDEFNKDEELRNVYYGSLDQTLDPRKTRGRDAALVGLKDLSAVGILKDARVDKARALLSKLYGGRRIDALDGLLVPASPAAAPSNAEERLAAALPTFTAGLVLDPKAATRPGTLRALLTRGLPATLHGALSDPSTSAEARALHGRVHFDLARLYWTASDVDQATALFSSPGKEAELSDDQRLLLATAIALGNGPEDAAAMMLKAPLSEIGVGRVAALDSIAKGGGPSAGQAAFNAALILQLAAPQGAKAAYWKDVAARFKDAASKLPAGPARAAAEERSRSADAIAAAIQPG